MTRGAGEHEEVPDEVSVSQTRGEECEAARVRDSTRYYQKDSGHGHKLPDGLDRDNREPAHREIQDHAEP